MKRIVITDGSGSYFDSDKAEYFEENTRWNGQNHISVITGSQWEHEGLYRTAGGRWVKNVWSDFQGSAEVYELIDNEEAARWLSINGHEHEACEKEIAALEIL